MARTRERARASKQIHMETCFRSAEFSSALFENVNTHHELFSPIREQFIELTFLRVS